MITDPIDVEIAAKLRALGKERHMTQSDLAAAAGVTFQQIQKYEKGANRFSASRLYRLAKALDTPVADFFPS